MSAHIPALEKTAAASGRSAQPTDAGDGPSGPTGDLAQESHATFDLFDLGRRAANARDTRLGARASFVRAKQLLSTGAWRGPRDASETFVEAADLAALGGGGFATAAGAGVKLLVGAGDLEPHRAAHASQGRSLWRFPFRSGDSPRDRRDRLAQFRELLRAAITLWGIMPTPEGEPEGLDTLRLVATLRLEIPEIPHVVLDVASLGPRLAQMALGFGGDELWAPIVSERALRLGGNANNPAMTRKEAAILIRGAGLIACERMAPETYSEEPA